MAQSISLKVQGTPTSYSSEEREQKWRQAIEKEAKLKRDDDVERSLSASTMFTVTIRFELVNERTRDLDNLIPPVIDTLFYAPPHDREKLPKFPMPTGALFKTIDDKHVFEIHATKMHAGTEGAMITVSWT